MIIETEFLFFIGYQSSISSVFRWNSRIWTIWCCIRRYTFRILRNYTFTRCFKLQLKFVNYINRKMLVKFLSLFKLFAKYFLYEDCFLVFYFCLANFISVNWLCEKFSESSTWDRPFSTYAKVSEKNNMSYALICARMYPFQGINISFPGILHVYHRLTTP